MPVNGLVVHQGGAAREGEDEGTEVGCDGGDVAQALEEAGVTAEIGEEDGREGGVGGNDGAAGEDVEGVGEGGPGGEEVGDGGGVETGREEDVGFMAGEDRVG